LSEFFFSIEHLRSQSLYNILFDERMSLSFTIAAGSRQRIHLGSESRVTRDHILLSQIRDFPFRRLLRLARLRWRYRIGDTESNSYSYSLPRKRHLRYAGNVCLFFCENNAYRVVGWHWTPGFDSYIPAFRPCLPSRCSTTDCSSWSSRICVSTSRYLCNGRTCHNMWLEAIRWFFLASKDIHCMSRNLIVLP
jgi:hypothetical protein